MTQVQVENFDKYSILTAHGHFTGGEETDTLVAAIEHNGINPGKSMIVDFQNVQYLSSIVIGLLVKWHVKFSESGTKIIFCSLNKTLKDVLTMTKVASFLNITDDVDSAVAIITKY